MIAHPAGGTVSFETLSPANALTPEFGALLVVAIAGFVGFEATVVLSEEAKDPRRTIARATHWAVLLPGLLCGLSAWAMSVSTGPGGIVAAARAEKTDLVFTRVAPYIPAALAQAGYVLFLTSVFAALLAFHAAVARYQFALGREGVLPGAWGRTHPRTGAPLFGSVTQSLLAVGVLITYYLTGLDPLVHLFAWLTTVGGLGVLILMWGASAAVVVFFLRNRRLENIWRGTLAPSLAVLLLSGVLVATVIGLGDLLQVSADSPFHWLFPVAYLGFALVGCCWALVVRRWRPDVYAAIGRGADGRVPTAPPEPPPDPVLRTAGSAPLPRRTPTGYAIRELVIRDITPVDPAEISALLAATIGEGQVARWLTPDPLVRRLDSPAYFDIFVEHITQCGEVYATTDPVSGDLVGAALWLPFTAPVPLPRDYDRRLKDICGSAFDRARDLDAALEAHHPTEPHHYLAFLAVRADRQGVGIGSALLARHHARVDAVGVPAYLEATDIRNRELYLRHGYVGQGIIRLPDGPPVWPMWRRPRLWRPDGTTAGSTAGRAVGRAAARQAAGNS
jgi:GNAT superfamily N-acetyltransferase